MVNKKKSTPKPIELPFVSICTPTFNRRPFIEHMINCFDHQSYPKHLMEWIIIDDGTDCIKDLVISHPNVKYFYYTDKMTLGKKRNLLHEKSKGDIIVYMDDDDYYPPDRVSHAVKTLTENKKALCAGSSEMYIYFKHIKKIYQFGPYSPNHATAGTFAFKRELLLQTRYNDTASLAEETEFLKNYTIPFVQLNPMKTILVVSHRHNTYDKKNMLENYNPAVVRESSKTVNMFIKDADMRKFYIDDVDDALSTYDAGLPSMKPDVLKQTAELEQQRITTLQKSQEIVMTLADGSTKQMSVHDILQTMQNQHQEIAELTSVVRGKDIELSALRTLHNPTDDF